MVASSAVQKIMAIYNDTEESSSCIAGLAGMMGGYPGRLSQKGLELELPEEITLEDASKINWENSKLEGIEDIKDDGTVVFTDKNCQIMKDLLNYECKNMKIGECEQRAVEVSRLYNEFAKKYMK